MAAESNEKMPDDTKEARHINASCIVPIITLDIGKRRWTSILNGMSRCDFVS